MSFGLVDIDRFQVLKKDLPNLRTFLDGEDVTDRCKWANDETGEAYLYLHDSLGKPFVNPFTGTAAMEMRKGKVEFRGTPLDLHDYDKDLEDFRKWML